ncbi:DNA polymerase III subunit alpha [Christiangramia salexigens]|uniref:DNA polymerase III subunit alpha n=1 Tax=Christiangramia salexigens TaxID=1913577 RepID=A0A1L3J799_9FLAO|nr:DNA polymerase III subunit alpha [Christiangramia salexigens]APG60974.1 DNA polymerase III subunit alpha [Christiangramia salexigens]
MYLNCHTYYSLRYGSMAVEDLCVLAKENKVSQLVVTDINNTSACLSFIKIAKDYDITPLVGIDFRNGVQQQYVGIAKNNEGYRQLNKHLSTQLHLQKDFEPDAPSLPDCFFIYPYEKIVANKKKEFTENEFIGISTESLRKLRFSTYREMKDKLVLLQTLSFRNKKDYNAHRLLRAIDNNCLLSKLPESEQGSFSHQMISPELIEEEFQDFPHILKNTSCLMQSCRVSFEFGSGLNRNLLQLGSSREADEAKLSRICYERLPRRYPKAGKEVYDRTEKELSAIIRLGFVSYFLINLDIVEYAKSKNYPMIGRGSGANSIVAYIIGITNVDPIELDLYFERFINPNRKSPPDFDIDFSWKDRNDVTDYIFRKYDHTALMGTYVTFKRRAVARELGKVFGLPKENIDKLSAGYFNYKELDHLEKLVLQYSSLIEGFPNYLSVHSGGILILNDSVFNYAGTFLPPKGFQTIQIDMNIAEEIGIHKFDILAQRGLSKITDAIEIIKKNQPDAEIEDMENISVFKEDPQINELLKTGDCMGVFYVESPAMRGLLTKLQTDNYLNLVAASSIIRPGISSGGMKEEYIKRHRDPERRKQGHPVMLEIMDDTYGIMVYQEDVMKVAHKFAGLSFDDADVLRRGMSGKKTSKDQMQKIEDKFRENCREKGYSETLITEVWEQISSFAGYAFPKGHSASYAVESYQSLYLKKYFPLEFMVAALNNGGGFYNVETYIQEIRKCGGRIHGPCINKSDHPNVIYGKDIYLGMGYIKELESKTIRQILESRQFFGEFKDFDDFIDRVYISIEQLSILLKINAFRFTGMDKHHLLWKAYFKVSKSKPDTGQAVLFKPKHRDFELPEFEYSRLVEAYDQMELLGFPLCSHFELLKHPMQRSVTAKDLIHHTGKEVQIYGNLITVKKTSTSNGKYMYFGTFYDPEGDIFDTVHFPDIAVKYPMRSKGIYLCRGIVVNELDYISISIKWISRQETMSDPRLVNSDFKVKLQG